MHLEIGTQLGHYRILGPLGAGGMGEVYRAEDTKLKRDVAVKILPSHVSTNPDTLSRFEREALALAQLSHPNILSIHDFGKYEGITLAVTELLEGETLRTRIERTLIPFRKALEISAGIADGLTAAHSKGIVHRDLKPENVFLTKDDQIKILDFGLARIDPPKTRRRSQAAVPTETDPGSIKGTVGYMSPEQLRGQSVDGRSDLFSLGCVLYEMLTGNRAFAKDTVADTMTAILKEDPPDLLESGRQISPEAERVVGHCLRKDPDKRFQSARDLSLHLKTIVSNPDISHSGLRFMIGRRRPWIWATLAMILITAVLAIMLVWYPLNQGQEPASGKPSIAVLYFENHTGDTSLNWLRTALTNMLVTDLSQSTQIEVLSTDRLYQILDEMGKLNDPITSSDVIQSLAQKADVSPVVLGSFIKAGETFRLSTRLQDVDSGRILATERVEGVGESSIFSMVDDITKRIRTSLEVGSSEDEQFVRELEDVSTSSVEAYKNYVEGNGLHYQSREQEAVPYFEKAIELDPEFAMAYAKLSVSHWNLGHVEDSHQYAKKAIDNIERLTARERYYVEGRYYSLNPQTYEQSITAYEKAISLYPDHSAARHNLANVYLEFERYEDAIQQYEELRKHGTDFAGTYGNLANTYALLGDYENGYGVLREFVDKSPENAVGHRYLAQLLLNWGKLNDAKDQFLRTGELKPGDSEVEQGLWAIAMLQGDRTKAIQHADNLIQSDDAFKQFTGLQLEALMALHDGDVNSSVSAFEKSAGIFKGANPLRANALGSKAGLELETEQIKKALISAEAAVKAGEGFPNSDNARYLVAIAKANDRDFKTADAIIQEIISRQHSAPGKAKNRHKDFMLGQLAMVRGNYDDAVNLFEVCETELPPTTGGKGEAYRILYSLGEAYWKSGNLDSAADRFVKVLDFNMPALNDPLPSIRSLFYLGEYHQAQGDFEKAKDYYRRFIQHWGDGTLDRDKITKARKILAS